MRRALGVVVLIAAGLLGGLGALWTVLKAAGAEVDVCLDGGCSSGWYFVAVLFGLAALAGVTGCRLLRSRREIPDRG